MFDLDRWKEIWNVLKSNKLRTFLTAFGVFWGIFMLVVMIASGRGLTNMAKSFLQDFATNSTLISGGQTSKPYKGFVQGRYISFNLDDLKAIKSNYPEIKYIAPRIDVYPWRNGETANSVTRLDKTEVFDIYGTTPDFNLIDPRKIFCGRFINQLDVLEHRKVAVISTRAREVLFKNGENILGQTIKINGINYSVIGEFDPSRIFGGMSDKPICLPITTLQIAYNQGKDVDYFAIAAHDGVDVSALEQKVIAALKRRHTIAPDDVQAVNNFNIAQLIKQQDTLFTGIAILIWIVGLGTLFSGIIGVSNIMLIVVKERTREIGVQRAIGASPNTIIKQILSESLVLTSLAGLMGLTAGVWLTELISRSMGADSTLKNPTIDFNIAIVALIILIICGLIAGWMPAKRAVSIKPIDALRDE
jgi:putative ABC transport system permease protein